jgi:hypothetical protein
VKAVPEVEGSLLKASGHPWLIAKADLSGGGYYFAVAPQTLRTPIFYDDERSLLDKLRLYRAREVDSVSFWRIGQGPPGLWGSIGSSAPGREPPAGGPAR